MARKGKPDPEVVHNQIVSRLEILDAIVVALDRRDEIMHIVGAAHDADAARHQLMATFGFNEVQAVAALDLQVRRFASHERRRIVDECESLRRELRSH